MRLLSLKLCKLFSFTFFASCLLFTVSNASEQANTSITTSSLTDHEESIDKFNKDIELINSKLDIFQKTQGDVLSSYEYALLAISLIGVGGLVVSGYLALESRLREQRQKESLVSGFENKISEISEQNNENEKKFLEYSRRQEDNNQELMKVIQANIEKTTTLFGSLNEILALHKTATELQTDVYEQQDKNRERIAEAINQEAIQIFNRFDRSSYSSRASQELFDRFSTTLKSRISEYSIPEDTLSACCFLILGLDFNEGDIQVRIEFLEKSAFIAQQHASDSDTNAFYPGISANNTEHWKQKLANECLYYFGILLYNCGQYQRAIEQFERALNHQKSGNESISMYIAEAKFLGHTCLDFNEIIREFESIATRLMNSPLADQEKNSLLSLLYVRMGNCYYAQTNFEAYKPYWNLDLALECYEKACAYSPTYLSKFSLAQALTTCANREDRRGTDGTIFRKKGKQLFSEVYPLVTEKIGSTIEAKILMMLYYILAICIKEGQIPGELPQTYLTQIFPEVGNLDAKRMTRIFSPRTKNDLFYADFLKEVQRYQQRLNTQFQTSVKHEA